MLPFGGQNTTLSTHLNIGFEDRRRRKSKSFWGERNMQDDWTLEDHSIYSNQMKRKIYFKAM